MMWHLEEGSARVTEEKEPAAPAEAPVEPAAPAPAPGDDSATPPATPDPIAALRDELGGSITATQDRLLRELEAVRQDARRAQGSSDKNSKRIETQFERRFAALESLLLGGMTEEQQRFYKAESENARLKAERELVDVEQRTQEEREEFGRWSARVLTDEKIDKDDPVFSAAWTKYAAEAKNPAEWRDALWRSVTTYRRSEADKRVEEERKRAQEVIDQERKKVTNTRRESAAPIDTAAGSGPASDSEKPPADDKAFAEWWERKRQQRRQRQISQMAR